MSNLDFKYMPKNTKNVFDKLCKVNFIKNYTLIGGTALSIQIKHRISEDLDFIIDAEFINVATIKRNISKIFPNYKIIKQDYNYQIDFIIEETKVTFFSSGAVLIPFSVKKHSFTFQKMNIAEIETIAVLKFSAIAQRNTIRDYYDLYFIAKYILNLKDIINTAKRLLPNLSPITYTETLIYIKDIPEKDLSQHLNPKEEITKDEMSVFFITELKEIINKL